MNIGFSIESCATWIHIYKVIYNTAVRKLKACSLWVFSLLFACFLPCSRIHGAKGLAVCSLLPETGVQWLSIKWEAAFSQELFFSCPSGNPLGDDAGLGVTIYPSPVCGEPLELLFDDLKLGFPVLSLDDLSLIRGSYTVGKLIFFFHKRWWLDIFLYWWWMFTTQMWSYEHPWRGLFFAPGLITFNRLFTGLH